MPNDTIEVIHFPDAPPPQALAFDPSTAALRRKLARATLAGEKLDLDGDSVVITMTVESVAENNRRFVVPGRTDRRDPEDRLVTIRTKTPLAPTTHALRDFIAAAEWNSDRRREVIVATEGHLLDVLLLAALVRAAKAGTTDPELATLCEVAKFNETLDEGTTRGWTVAEYARAFNEGRVQ